MPKILIIAPSWVGDAVMAQPLLRRLREQYPDAVIDAFAPAWVAPVMECMPEIRRVVINPLAHGEFSLKLRWKLGRALRQDRYDHAIILPNSLKSALIPFFAGIPLRTGFKGEMRFGLVNNIRQLDKQALPLMVERFAALAEHSDTPLRRPLENPRLVTNKAQIQTTLNKLGLAPKKPVIAFCVGAEYGPAKRWPTLHFAELACMLADEGHEIWLLGSHKDTEIGAEIEQIYFKCTSRLPPLPPAGEGWGESSPLKEVSGERGSSSLRNLCGQTDLAEAIDLLAVAKLAVVNDSGLMHIAAALDKPMIALFGSSSPGFTPPLSDKARIVSLNLPCSPCFKRVCPLGHFDCMMKLTPTQVFKEISAITPKSGSQSDNSDIDNQGSAIHDSSVNLESSMSTIQTNMADFIESIAKEISANTLIFPTFPDITMRIRNALNDPGISATKVAKIVGTEPVLSAQLLRLANSAALCTGCRPATDLPTAIKRLGYALVRNAAIALGIRQLTQDKSQSSMHAPMEELWRHSIQVAVLSYVLAKRLTGLNPDTAMLAGLLHDIGMFYILIRASKHPDLFVDGVELKSIPHHAHAQISSAILESWEIPQDIVSVARDHATFDRIHYAPADLTDVVMVANILAKRGLPKDTEWPELPSAFGRLKLDATTCAAAMIESEEEISLMTQVFS